MEQNYANLKKAHDAAKRMHREKYEQNSKKRLITNVEKKFKTTMIGALSQFEQLFGELWGQDSNSPPTQEQEEWYEKWQAVRTEILNNGNNQLRACLDEIAQYTMTWDRYKTEFIVRKDNGGNNND